jgi:hypothetical protein
MDLPHGLLELLRHGVLLKRVGITARCNTVHDAQPVGSPAGPGRSSCVARVTAPEAGPKLRA